MGSYALKRLAGAIPTLLIGITLTFIILHLAPGDPTDRFLDPSLPQHIRENVRREFGLDRPIFEQYFSYLNNVALHFDFGISFDNRRPASEIIFDALPATLLLTISALVIGLILGISLGIISAVTKGSRTDRAITAMLMFSYSLPSFWLGMMGILIFAQALDWFPSSQLTSINHDSMSFFGRLADYFSHLALPASTLGLASAAAFGRYVRSGLVEALNSDYVIAARARGVSEVRILFTYGLRNTLVPLISVLGVMIPFLFSGAVAVEVVFSLPGMGRVMVDAVFGRDYPVILAASTLAFVTVIIGNLLADVGYALADPRVSYHQGSGN